MRTNQSFEQLIQCIQRYSRERCIHELLHFPEMSLDFTADFLHQQSADWLRHTLLAAALTARHRDRPDEPRRRAG